MELLVDHPIDLDASLMGGQAHRWREEQSGLDRNQGDDLGEERWFSGVVRGNLIKIRQTGPQRLEFHAAPMGETEAVPLMRDYFRLDDPLDAIQAEICRDERVAAMVKRYPGLRALRQEPWECLVAYICSANSNIKRIHQVMENMADAFGEPVEVEGVARHSFPGAARLAEAGEQELRRLGLGFRAPYVDRASQEVARGALDLEALVVATYAKAKERLLECYGIGNKIADCIALFSLDKLEAFPIDVWVRRALGEWYFPDEKTPPDRELLAWAQDYFGRYAGYANQYLFHGRRLEK